MKYEERGRQIDRQIDRERERKRTINKHARNIEILRNGGGGGGGGGGEREQSEWKKGEDIN